MRVFADACALSRRTLAQSRNTAFISLFKARRKSSEWFDRANRSNLFAARSIDHLRNGKGDLSTETSPPRIRVPLASKPPDCLYQAFLLQPDCFCSRLTLYVLDSLFLTFTALFVPDRPCLFEYCIPRNKNDTWPQEHPLCRCTKPRKNLQECTRMYEDV